MPIRLSQLDQSSSTGDAELQRYQSRIIGPHHRYKIHKQIQSLSEYQPWTLTTGGELLLVTNTKTKYKKKEIPILETTHDGDLNIFC